MSAGNINAQKNMHTSNSLNARPQSIGTSQSKIKAVSKKINQSSSMNPTERENAHKVQAFLDESSQQFMNVGGAATAHSLTRSNRDY